MLIRYFILILLILSGFRLHAWKFEFEKEGISIYTRDEPGTGFDAFKGEAFFHAGTDEIAHLIMDISRLNEWSYAIDTVELIKKDVNTVKYRYVADTPPVVRKREAYFINKLTKHADTTIILVNTYEAAEKVPSGFIRMAFSNGYWKLIPVNEHTTKVIFYTHADPGGFIPSWLANLAAVEAPYITMKNLRHLLQAE